MSCPSHDDIVGYVLGALEPGEAKTVAKHASGCERCAAELRRLAPAVGVLAESVEQVEPPESLRQGLMATVHSEAGSSFSAADRAAPRRERVRGFLWRPAVVLGATALVAAGVVGYVVRDDGQNVQSFTFEQGAGNAGGRVEIEEDSATLHAHGMDALAKGGVYQVWVAENGTIVPSATFVPHTDGTAIAAVPEAAAGADEVMVTREPEPGRTSPTLPAVLSVRLD